MGEPIELRDENGNVIGTFTPGDEVDIASLFDLEKARETLARERGKGVPLSDIWKRLGVTETNG